MLSKNIKERLNWQINREIYSAYFYLGMASYASSIGLKGFANWFNVQVREELTHAERIYNYVISENSRVLLKEIETPPQDFLSAKDLFEKTLGHEKKVTKMIEDLVKLAKDDKDKATEKFLEWFVKEQQEEEENASSVLENIKVTGESKERLLKIDSELARRTFK